MKRLTVIAMVVLAMAGRATAQDLIRVSEADEKMETGAFTPSWQGLSGYVVPEWFRDAKFGIWAHWGPQCVEGSGDWMARSMYQEGSRQYKWHAEHYGHPSEVGFKDILPLFRAERWQPDELVAYYKKVGARYFFALGNHHDNFDLWDSQYQEWNSKRMGPQRDLLAGWAAAARRQGLPFGISLHADHAWLFYEPAQRHDTIGQLKGVPYDGRLTRADGQGKWWEGLDPQMLYAQNHPLSHDSWNDGSIHGQWGWEGGAARPSEAFVTNFYNRTLDCIRRYEPDLLYFDTTVLPFYPVSDAGLKIAAHFYNHHTAQRGDAGVVFGKILDEQQRQRLVWDVERGAPNHIISQPWQTCTCLGNWHWNEDYSVRNRYKQAPVVVKMLVDVVSKNGNLLLSVPLRADGTFDEHEREILDGVAEWMAQNSECIYATRPWRTFGEGPVAESDIKLNAQGFNEGFYGQVGASEIRFTQKDGYLYAIALGWPEQGVLCIKSLAADKVGRVSLLGYGRVKHRQTAEGLMVTLPAEPVNKIAPVLKIKLAK